MRIPQHIVLREAILQSGKPFFTTLQARDALNASASSTTNLLTRLSREGVITKLSRGHYAYLDFEDDEFSDLVTFVSGTFREHSHRISYLSALDHYGYVAHPVRAIYVSSVAPVRYQLVAAHPLRLIRERPETIQIGSLRIGGTFVSCPERAILECAIRLDLVGSVERVGHALLVGRRDMDAQTLFEIAELLGVRGVAALRRVLSIADALDVPFQGCGVPATSDRLLNLDPREREVIWTDLNFGIHWNLSREELLASVRN
jgi:predicted transcriptional regulator of viral defense system